MKTGVLGWYMWYIYQEGRHPSDHHEWMPVSVSCGRTEWNEDPKGTRIYLKNE